MVCGPNPWLFSLCHPASAACVGGPRDFVLTEDAAANNDVASSPVPLNTGPPRRGIFFVCLIFKRTRKAEEINESTDDSSFPPHLLDSLPESWESIPRNLKYLY